MISGAAHALQFAFVGLWGSVSIYALVRGGTPERLTAFLFVAGALLSRELEHSQAMIYKGVEKGLFAVDTSMFLVILGVALASARFWPMLMAVFQGAQILVHVGRWLAPGIVPDAYFVTEIAWSFPMLLLLAAGTKRHRLRLERMGIDYSWAFQLPRAYRDGRPFETASVGPKPHSRRQDQPSR